MPNFWRAAISALLCAALPGFALAQPATTMVAVPRGSAPSDGITVSAGGYADAPADAATVTLYINASKGTIAPANLTPVIDALVETGVERSAITTSFDVTGALTQANNAEILVRVEHPAAEKLRAAIPAVAAAFASQPQLNVGNANVQLSFDACSTLVDAARANAIAAARKRADEIAKTLGVRVGPVRAFSDVEPPLDYRGRCTNSYSLPSYGPQRFGSPGDLVTIRVSAQVTIRYAIR